MASTVIASKSATNLVRSLQRHPLVEVTLAVDHVDHLEGVDVELAFRVVHDVHVLAQLLGQQIILVSLLVSILPIFGLLFLVGSPRCPYVSEAENNNEVLTAQPKLKTEEPAAINSNHLGKNTGFRVSCCFSSSVIFVSLAMYFSTYSDHFSTSTGSSEFSVSVSSNSNVNLLSALY